MKTYIQPFTFMACIRPCDNVTLCNKLLEWIDYMRIEKLLQKINSESGISFFSDLVVDSMFNAVMIDRYDK